MKSFSLVGCITPSVPINGSASPYLSTEEGAKIKLNCDNGLNEWITCINSTWVTDSQELVCTPPNSPGKYFSWVYDYNIMWIFFHNCVNSHLCILVADPLCVTCYLFI